MSRAPNPADISPTANPPECDPGAPPAIAVVGFSNCGKTELICKLLSLAQERGYRVAAVKHSHKNLEVDRPGKDTWRFRQAGAVAVALASPGLLQVTQHLTADPPLAAVLAALPGDLDFALVEGYKRGPLPKIVFLAGETPEIDPPQYENTIAFISEDCLETALPVFSRDAAPEILDFILRWLHV